MTPLKIQYELKKKGISQKSIAQKLGISDMSVSDTINKNIVSDRIMKAVSEAIDKDHREVFPEYYLQRPKRSTSKTAAR